MSFLVVSKNENQDLSRPFLPMGAGVLPVAFRGGRAYFLFSRERKGTKNKDSGKWSDFGGKTERGESYRDTAIREAHEESMGLMGTTEDIAELIDECLVGTVDVGFYRTYIVEVQYDSSIPEIFRDVFTKAPKGLVDSCNGLYEKDDAMWLRSDKIKHFRNEFRSWYRRSGIPWRAAGIVSGYTPS